MGRITRNFALAGAAGMLASVAPVESYSAETLAMLDPARGAPSLCGSRQSAEALQARLQLAAAFVGQTARPRMSRVPLYDGLSGVHWPITTRSPLAQRYFDQGLTLSYGFNHAAAIAAFREAQRLDPGCAMCWWGEAFALGPNINAPMEIVGGRAAFNAIRRAQQLARFASPSERALIEATGRRYSPDPLAERAPLDLAYANAMLDVARRYPTHDEIAVLAAEAAMDTHPWDYWEADKRTPKGRLGEAVQLVEAVLARNPNHPQAAHLYIHLMENGPDPRRAEAAADRLARPIVPAAGHLVHMPAHIYLRLGRHRDSIRSNIFAARADEEYLRRSGEKGLVRYGYYPHNVHFIVTSAQMAGDLPTAVREAKRLGALIDPGTAARLGWIQAIQAAPYFAIAQGGTPRQMLALGEPAGRLPYVVGMRHYVRAVARAQQRNRREFDREIAALRRIRQGNDFTMMTEQGMPAPDLLLLAETVARARLAHADRRYDEAARIYREAVAIEDRLPYMEPPWWYFPVRQSLGAALYQAGRYDQARSVFRDALARSPNNGWALYGLAATERALGHPAEAAAAQAALKRAWLGDPRWLRMERL